MEKRKNIPFGRPIIGDQERSAVEQVLKGDVLVHGPKVDEFEHTFAGFVGAPFAIAVNSCTAALHLAYLAIGVRSGDEVLVPSQTHVATAHAIEYCGAKPIFVDAEISSGNLDLDQIETLINERTKAIAIVHFLGNPVDMKKLSVIARKHKLAIVEDCALAIGSYVGETHAGLVGDVGCFSFYPVKHITTGEGGMIVTRDEEIARKVKHLRAFGVDRTINERKVPGVYDVTALGYNYRMNEMEAALGVEQVKRIPWMLKRRQQNYDGLFNGLSELDGISLFGPTSPGMISSHYCFNVILSKNLAVKREQIINQLNLQGVGTSVYYPHPVPCLEFYHKKYGYEVDKFPIAYRISSCSIALPVGPHIESDDIEYIIDATKAALGDAY